MFWHSSIAVFRIRIDPGFFANPDPDFKNPDPSIKKLMGSKWCFWLGFWGLRSLTKKERVESAKNEFFIYCTCTLLYSFWTFFSWIRIFRDRIRIFGWSGSGLRNKSSNRIRGKKNLDSKHCILIDCNVLPTQIFFSLHVALTEEYRWLLETNLVHDPDPLCFTFYTFQRKSLKSKMRYRLFVRRGNV